jgi:hypothetical protein
MDILAKLRAEESTLRQQLDTIRAAIRIVKAENKALCKKTNGLSAPGKKSSREQCLKDETDYPVTFFAFFPELRPPLLGSLTDPSSSSGRQNALLHDFQFFAGRIAQSFRSRSDSAQFIL